MTRDRADDAYRQSGAFMTRSATPYSNEPLHTTLRATDANRVMSQETVNNFTAYIGRLRVRVPPSVPKPLGRHDIDPAGREGVWFP